MGLCETGMFVRDPSGGQRRLTSNEHDRPHSWSPDGREIAYVRQRPHGDAGEPGVGSSSGRTDRASAR